MKIVVLDGYAANPGDLSWEPLAALGELTVYDRTAAEDVAARMEGADMVLTNKTVLTRERMAECKTLKYVGVLATGYNVVDIAAAKDLGVIVTNIPAYSTDSVAQMVFALLLEICHNVGHHSAQVHAGRWSSNADFCFWDSPLMELAGKTLGLFGYGHIGKAVATIARAFGMRVLVHTRTAPSDGTQAVSCEELLAQSDFISVHAPLNEQSRNKFDAAAFAACKPGAYFVNTARGPIVDEQALADAVRSGRLSGAAVDVLHAEPMVEGCPLLGVPGITLTPHVAWAPFETRTRLMGIVCDNLQNWVDGRPTNVVNHPKG